MFLGRCLQRFSKLSVIKNKQSQPEIEPQAKSESLENRVWIKGEK